MSTERDDEELVEAARRGDEAAIGALVRRHQGLVRLVLRRLLGRDDAAVDDVAQEAFIAAFDSLATYEPERAPFAVWLLGVARLRALRHLRQEQRRRRHEAAAGLAAEEAALRCARTEEAEAGRLHAEIDALRACVERLPEHLRPLVEARYRQERPLAEIARLAGRSEVAVRVALHRLRTALRTCIERRIAAEP